MRAAVAAMLLALAACGSPQQLPLSIPRCDAVMTKHGIELVAQVSSKANKPISELTVAVEFYQNFRSTRMQGQAKIVPELDPGQQREITFAVASSATAQGPAMRCFATHIGYLDGTSADARP